MVRRRFRMCNVLAHRIPTTRYRVALGQVEANAHGVLTGSMLWCLISMLGHRVHDYIMGMWSQQADSGNFEAVVDATALRCKQQLPWWQGVAMHVGRSRMEGPARNTSLDTVDVGGNNTLRNEPDITALTL